MKLDEIKRFYKQRTKFDKKIYKAESNYTKFLEKTSRKFFPMSDEDFQSSFKDEKEELILDLSTEATPRDYEILANMVIPKIRYRLDELQNYRCVTTADRIKIEDPRMDKNGILNLLSEHMDYLSRKQFNEENCKAD